MAGRPVHGGSGISNGEVTCSMCLFLLCLLPLAGFTGQQKLTASQRVVSPWLRCRQQPMWRVPLAAARSHLACTARSTRCTSCTRSPDRGQHKEGSAASKDSWPEVPMPPQVLNTGTCGVQEAEDLALNVIMRPCTPMIAVLAVTYTLLPDYIAQCSFDSISRHI